MPWPALPLMGEPVIYMGEAGFEPARDQVPADFKSAASAVSPLAPMIQALVEPT